MSVYFIKWSESNQIKIDPNFLIQNQPFSWKIEATHPTSWSEPNFAP